MSVSAGPYERVIVSGDATRELAGQRCPGVLALAERHLMFTPTWQPNVDSSRFALSVPYEEIADVRPLDALRLVPRGVSVIRAGAPDPIRFHLKGRDQWREMIDSLRRDALAGAGPEALLARVASILRPAPVAPVVSWPAIAAWITAPFAFVPLLGLLPALALVVFAAILFARGAREHDRRAGVTALALGGAALACWGVGLASAIVQGGFEQRAAAPGGDLSVLAQVIQVVVLVFSIVLHECGHGLAAYWAGDTTARRAGRLTINPVPHVELFGSVLLPALMIVTGSSFIFGWAKPVPVNPAAFRRRTRGDLAVSLAGVSANLLIATVCVSLLAVLGAAIHLLAPGVSSRGFWDLLTRAELSGVPAAAALSLAADVLKYGALVNMNLFALNLLPIPPLDGSHVLEKLLPRSLAPHYAKLGRLGFVLVMLCLVTPVLDYWRLPAMIVLQLALALVGALTGLG